MMTKIAIYSVGVLAVLATFCWVLPACVAVALAWAVGGVNAPHWAIMPMIWFVRYKDRIEYRAENAKAEVVNG